MLRCARNIFLSPCLAEILDFTSAVEIVMSTTVYPRSTHADSHVVSPPLTPRFLKLPQFREIAC